MRGLRASYLLQAAELSELSSLCYSSGLIG